MEMREENMVYKFKNVVCDIECKEGLIEFILVQDRLVHVNASRSAGDRISDHHMVEAKSRCLRKWCGGLMRRGK